MNPLAVGGCGGGSGGGGFGGAGASIANTGDYLVTLYVGNQTFKQTFRVERVSGGGEAAAAFGEDENHDGMGRYTPKTPNQRSK